MSCFTWPTKSYIKLEKKISFLKRKNDAELFYKCKFCKLLIKITIPTSVDLSFTCYDVKFLCQIFSKSENSLHFCYYVFDFWPKISILDRIFNFWWNFMFEKDTRGWPCCKEPATDVCKELQKIAVFWRVCKELQIFQGKNASL